jgi:polynucleotide 5'-hydroxyl-kinase GRC3/NOL9
VDEHEALVERAVRETARVMLLGGLDSGKTTLGRAMVRAACAQGRTAAFIDADVGQKSVGPPTTIGLKLIRGPEDAEPEGMTEADALSFVGSTSPQGHMLSVVTGTARLLAVATESGAEFVVVDTSGMVSGVYGQLLKYHKMELVRPDLVVGLQRGEELDPLLGIARRFFSGDVYALGVHSAVAATSVEQRAQNRERAMERYFAKPVQRWRVKPTVFMPALPALFDLRELDRLVVGLSDGQGSYLGIGFLEHSNEDGVLRLISPVAEAPKALRLGSVRLEEGFRAKRVDLRNLFGTD